MKLKTAFVATDYTCSPGVARSKLDYYFIPTESLKTEYIEQGIPGNKIVATGIPVRREFYSGITTEAAKRKLGIDPANTHLLVMCGSMGCGPLEKLTKLLAKQMDTGMILSVVCGTNEKLKEELTEKFGSASNIHVYGFVQDMNPLMDSADLYLTKPGGLSTTEAAAKHLPMVFIDAVAGCEEYNLNYFVSIGGAVTAEEPEDLVQLCIRLMKDSLKRKTMAKALAASIPPNAAQQIYEVFSGENVKNTKTDQIGTTVRRLIETNTEKRDGTWQTDM